MPRRRESQRTQSRRLRIDGPPTPAELKWIASERPATRAECVDGPRPCWVWSCRHHNGIEILPNGSLLINEDVAESCSLDVAEARGVSLPRIGEIEGYSGERIRQFLVIAQLHLIAGMRDEPLPSRARCILCSGDPLEWVFFCQGCLRGFSLSAEARNVLEKRASLLEGLAAYVERYRRET